MKKLWMVLFAICFLFCGCDAGYNRHSAGVSDYLNAVSVVQCGVPYTGNVDLRLDQIELLETDDYGRKLFLYRIASSQESFLLITQKTVGSLIYYYENVTRGRFYCHIVPRNKLNSCDKGTVLLSHKLLT